MSEIEPLLPHCAVVRDHQESGRTQDWAYRSSVCSFAWTAHSFACSTLLAPHCTLCSRAPLCSFVCSFAHSQARGIVNDRMSQVDLVLSHSALSLRSRFSSWKMAYIPKGRIKIRNFTDSENILSEVITRIKTIHAVHS